MLSIVSFYVLNYSFFLFPPPQLFLNLCVLVRPDYHTLSVVLKALLLPFLINSVSVLSFWTPFQDGASWTEIGKTISS